MILSAITPRKTGVGVYFLPYMQENKPDMIYTLKKMIKIQFTDEVVIELTQIVDYMSNFNEIYD